MAVVLGGTVAYVGKRVVRRDAVEKVTGRGRYVDDLAPGRGSAGERASVLHGATVRSPIPHGKVLAVRTAAARGVAGVAAVVTAADIAPPATNLLPLVVNDYPLLAHDRVRFVGQPVALVAAETVEAARQAAALVEVDYEPLPAVFEPLEALEPGAATVHEPDNALRRNHILKGDPDQAFAECDVVVERTYSTGHQVHVYLETQGMLAEPDGHGGLLVRGSMQCPYYVLDAVVAATGLQRNQVQIEQTETGGGFGGKEDVPSLVAAHAAILCLATGRPVKIVYDREEDFATMSKRHPGWARVRYGARRSGEILACDVRYVINGGAYTTLSPIVLWRGTVHAAGAYEIPNVRIESVAAATNTVPCGAFRGFGQPQIAFAQESCIDELARELDLDPAELRRRNMLRPGRLTSTSQRIDDSCGLPQALDRVLEASGWAARRDELARSSASGIRRRGLGVAVGYYGVGLGAGGRHLDRAHASIQVEADGSVLVAVGNTEMGQGAKSELAQIAADALGAPYEAILVRPVDTSRVPDSGPTVASRTTISSGMAVLDAARGLRLRLDEVARRLLDGPPEASEGVFTSSSAKGRSLTFTELAAACHKERVLMQSVGQWRQDRTTFDFQGHGQGDAYEVYAFSATVAEVEVDVETGVAEVIDLWTAIDVGRAVNPDQVEAQIEGGVLQAMGYALTEELVLEGGRIRNPNLSGYIIPTAVDMPRVHPFIVEAAYSEGPYGAKGFGELPMIGTPPAIANAVAHALGARCRRLPMLPERLLALVAGEEALP
jgi:CO/xanthine dehydrogenase Mo-binding subunit